ncbi:MAG: glycosyltransferase family 2 protein [Taibaiella sp.]|nr:glycosyltransferase family 2 protein [Taibaiella sp.]
MQYQPIFEQYRLCVIVPTYNNGGTIKAVIDSVFEYTNNIIVVNDGSNDNTATILSQYHTIGVLQYAVNKGKGYALRSAFKQAIISGYDYAITIDADGQHFATDLPLFLDKLLTNKDSLIIGARELQQENMPGRNTFANKFSNFWFYVETGLKAPDTQSGYRLYPLYLMKKMIFFGVKYEFEVEVLVRSAWKGISISWIPIQVYYPPPDLRISHFRPLRDFTRISVLNTILVIITFLYIWPRNIIMRFSKIDNIKKKLREQLVNETESNFTKALSIGLGVFMGIIPIWGFQMAVALLLAMLLRLNKVLTLIASNISIPPMIPIIVFLSFLMGKVWLPGSSMNLIFSRSITIQAIKLNVTQYILGSITLALTAGTLAFCITYILLHTVRKPGRQMN